MTDQHLSPLPQEMADLLGIATDPVVRMLLTGEATTVFEAEEKFLDASYPDALSLLTSPLSDKELAEHPLFRLYRSYGSPPREDSLL